MLDGSLLWVMIKIFRLATIGRAIFGINHSVSPHVCRKMCLPPWDNGMLNRWYGHCLPIDHFMIDIAPFEGVVATL